MAEIAKKVLIMQSDAKSAQALAALFKERGDRVWGTGNSAKARSLLRKIEPELVVMDLHLAANGWQNMLQHIGEELPGTKVLCTTRYPDPERELHAKSHGVQVFLREPYTPASVEQALGALALQREDLATVQQRRTGVDLKLPRVRVPMRLKITVPYALLALALAMAAAYVVSRVVLESIEERFTNQLIEAGKLASDWMVQEEGRRLETMRLLARTQGMPEAIVAADSERLRALVLPVAINAQEEAIEILSTNGRSLLSLHHNPGGSVEDYTFTQGEDYFIQWKFVRHVLDERVDPQGDKFAGLARAPWGDYFYVAGPIYDDHGQLVGAILVGKSLNKLTRQIWQATLAHTSIYDFNGQLISSSLFAFQEYPQPLNLEQVEDVLDRQDDDSMVRSLNVSSIDYRELIGMWEVRAGDDLGLLGVALTQNFLVSTSRYTLLQIFILVTLAFLLVIAVGIFLANRITSPLLRVVTASAEVAQGNLDVKVQPLGNDEVAVLAHSFNQMVSGLREGSIYRDLLGRTVSPEVRAQLRHTFASGDLQLGGQQAVATVLMADVRGFTTLSEKTEPALILQWLNELFGEIVPIITNHSGVVNKFDGDAVLAFFGILPRPLAPKESAHLACQTAVEMLQAVERVNARRQRRGEPPFVMGIGLNTGTVTAGALGAADRMHYTIIGDTVNTTQRLESLTRELGETGAVISQFTYIVLQELRGEFQLEPLRKYSLKGKEEQIMVYRLWPS